MKYTPHPPSSNGKMKKDKEVCNKSIKDYVDRITNPIFNKVLLESNDNPMMVGGVQESKSIKFLWQPHNYRLYFNFNKRNFKVVTPSLYKYPAFSYKLANYGSEHHFDNFMGCRIVIKKNLVEVINKSHHKQWRLITASNINEIDTKINEVVSKLNNQGINALKGLIRLCGGISDCKILKVRGEHGIHGIDYLDRIPEEMIIHDTVFKKQYKKKLEFYEPAHIKNVVTNNAINDIAPDIAASIKGLENSITTIANKFGSTLTGIIPVLNQLTNINIEVTKLRRDVTKIQRHKKNPINNKDLRKWI